MINKIRNLRWAIYLSVLFLLLGFVGTVWADGETGTVVGYPSLKRVEGELNGGNWNGRAGTLEFQIGTGSKVPVFCTDISHHTGKGDEFVASDEEMDCRVKWLLTHYPPLLEGSDGWSAEEMAARQLAVWHFSDGLLPDDETSIGERAWEIIDAVPDGACAADAPKVTIAPASANNSVGASQTFTVTVTRGGEPIANQQVDLTSDAGMLSADTVTTDENGQATFTLTRWQAGDAQIDASTTLSLPVGTIFTGVDPNKQKLVLGETTSGLVHAQASGTWTADGSITTVSFVDYNMNGQPDDGEPMLEGLDVDLYQSSNQIASGNSNGDGKVTFDGLNGAYTVEQEEQDGWHATTPLSQEVTVDDDVQTIYFGQIKLPVIIGQAYEDADQDSVWDDGEAVLSGWDLQLFRVNGSSVVGMKGKTDAEGAVVFSNDPQRDPPDLKPGAYYVKETLPEDGSWLPTDSVSKTVTVEAGDVEEVAIGNFRVQPALALSKSGPAEAHEGDSITYQFDVTNTGNVPLEDITVTDPLLGGELADCAFDQLDVDETLTCEATYQIPAGSEDPLANTATASGVFSETVSDSATFEIDILHVPEAQDDSAETVEDTAVELDVLANDSDPDADESLTIDDASDPAHGTVIHDGYTLTYTPDPDFSGDDSFTYTVSDGSLTDTATVAVKVLPAASSMSPILECVEDNADGTYTAYFGYENSNDHAVTITHGSHNFINLSEYDGAQPELFELPQVIEGRPGRTGFYPDGPFAFTLDFDDGETVVWNLLGHTATASNNPAQRCNQWPEAKDDTFSTDEDTDLSGNVLDDNGAGADSLGDEPATTFLESDVSNGSLTLNSDGSFTYAPASDFNGTDAFTYALEDSNGDTSTVTVTITVHPVNDAPEANDDTSTTNQNTPVTIGVLSNDEDVDGDALNIVDMSDPEHGAVELGEDEGAIRYTPDPDFSGDDSFTYTVSDGSLTDTATVTVHVTNDTDGDGIPDESDDDTDGDGLPDEVEAGEDPENPVDTDGDGVPDYQDLDSDGDGIPDSVEVGEDPYNPVDTDGDSVPDYQDLDSDGDGIPDSVEAGEDPYNPVDTDGDGVPDYLDLDSDGDGISDAGEWSEGPDDPLAGCTADDPICYDNDADGDGIPNYLDLDSDGDGIPDDEEGLKDSDGDGIPDWLDTDPVQESSAPYTIFLPFVSSSHQAIRTE